MEKRTLLIHICCAPDALYVAGLLGEFYKATGFFYNPNIQPREEYDLRLEEARTVSRRLDMRLIEGPYDEARWMKATAKFKDEPEKGRRCDVCYALRLQRTAEAAREAGFDVFTTVMSLSPWKKAQTLNRIGKLFAARHKVEFLEADFKKKDGFRKSVELSKAQGLYRQDYCGCLFSQRARELKDESRAEAMAIQKTLCGVDD